MSQSLLTAFILFALVMCFTPGPNNIMLLSSAVTYGFRRTLPHIMGITIGFAFMVGAVGLGLGTVFVAYPVLESILKYAGAAYLIYLAVAIAMADALLFRKQYGTVGELVQAYNSNLDMRKALEARTRREGRGG